MLDVVVADYEDPNTIWLNNDGVLFTDLDIRDNRSTDVALGDLDGDGDLDVMVANEAAQPVWTNDGTGCSAKQTHLRLEQLGGWTGDFDEDGDLDAMIANCCGPKNQGTPTTAPAHLPRHSLSAKLQQQWACPGGLRRDGDPDAMIANSNAANTVWFNTVQGACCIYGVHQLDVAGYQNIGGEYVGGNCVDAFCESVRRPPVPAAYRADVPSTPKRRRDLHRSRRHLHRRRGVRRLPGYLCRAMTNGDGTVDVFDLLAVIDDWGTCLQPRRGINAYPHHHRRRPSRRLASPESDSVTGVHCPSIFPSNSPSPTAKTFGISVAIDGDICAIGAQETTSTGSAYVFTKSGGSWSYIYQLHRLRWSKLRLLR